MKKSDVYAIGLIITLMIDGFFYLGDNLLAVWIMQIPLTYFAINTWMEKDREKKCQSNK